MIAISPRYFATTLISLVFYGEWGENPVDSRTDEDWIAMVDKVLETMDTNNDGFINFLEFKNAQEKDKDQKQSSLTPSNVWK